MKGFLKVVMFLLLTSVIIIVVVVLVDRPSGVQRGASTYDPYEWTEEYEQGLNDEFADDESGIINFDIDGSLISVTVNPKTVSASEYSLMARAWARKFSMEKQKHGGSNTTAYIKANGRTVASASYSKSKGFH